VPWTIFTEPEIARLGLSGDDAGHRNIPYDGETAAEVVLQAMPACRALLCRPVVERWPERQERGMQEPGMLDGAGQPLLRY
jgi:hypothetical protein